MRKFLGYLTVLILALVAAGAVLLFTPLGERPLTALFPVGEVKHVEFRTMELADKPNQYLVCPPDYCSAVPQAFSPVFGMPVEQLHARWQKILDARPRVRLLDESPDGLQFDYVQRSARFRFPDIITVRFIPVPPEHSTLAVYSRSVYGRSDLGVNHARVEAWLTDLRKAE
jgi:uncharacterized protein (DUF1499 family)